MDDSGASTQTWDSHAFGLAIRSSFQVPGLPPDGGAHPLPQTRLDLVEPERIDEIWKPTDPQMLLAETFEGTDPARTIEFDEKVGYRLYARHFGLALISPSGDQVVCAPPGPTDWSWQRFLVGRILPWTALARGLEVLHASAVAIDGRAIAFVAPSGGGKTSLALRLTLGGAGFVTDDVLTVESTGDGLMAHPGANIVAVRPEVKASLSDEEWRRLGRMLGHSVKTYVEVQREPEWLPLDAIYFLTPDTSSPEIEAGVEAKDLLASTFISSVVMPQRLARHLETCAEISSSVPLFWLPIDPEDGMRTATMVHEHAMMRVAR